jgi:hypothetical protein
MRMHVSNPPCGDSGDKIMSQSPKFNVVETPKGWMVSIPAAMNGEGRRIRKYFPGKTAAEKFAASMRRQHGSGLRSSMIPVALAHQAAEASRILEGSGISLVEAARLAVARVATEDSKELFRARYARALLWGESHWSDRYAADMDRLSRWAPSLMPLPCGTIDSERIELALREIGPLARSTISKRAAYVQAVLGFRERHQKATVIHILTEHQRKASFEACESADERWAVALLLYAGIRPDSENGEISRLDWSDVGRAEIYVSQGASKTGSDRHIPITPALRRVIAGHPKSGPVAPAGWKKRWQRIRKTAGIGHLQDVMRHTFASHYLAWKGEDACKLVMGHTAGSTTLFRHYRRAVLPAAGKAFFQ